MRHPIVLTFPEGGQVIAFTSEKAISKPSAYKPSKEYLEMRRCLNIKTSRLTVKNVAKSHNCNDFDEYYAEQVALPALVYALFNRSATRTDYYKLPQMLEKQNIEQLSSEDLSIQDRTLYMNVWNERPHVCQCCKEPLYEPLLFMFHHVLAKRKRKTDTLAFEKYRHCKWNIMLLCWQCHDTYERFSASKTVIPIVQYRTYLLTLIESPDCKHDNEHIWIKGDSPDMMRLKSIFGKKPIIIKK